jgi:tetratricopeptide (TPR) repeat protein
LAEEADPKLRRAERREWLQRLVADHANLRAAFAWSQEEVDRGEMATRLAGALTWFWDWNGDLPEGREWLKAALERSDSTERTRTRAKALFGAGYLACFQGDSVAARFSLEEAVAIWREVGEKGGLAVSLAHLAVVALWYTGDLTTAGALLEESVALSRESGEQWNLFASILKLGQLAALQRDRATECARYEEALAVSREIGDPTPVAWSLLNLGENAMGRGDHVAARAFVEESVAIFRDLGEKYALGCALASRGYLARVQGDYETARSSLAEAVAIWQQTGAWRRLVRALLELGIVAREQGDGETARSLGEEALTISRERGDRLAIAHCLRDLGSGAYVQGDVAKAQGLLEESIAIGRSLADQDLIAWSLVTLAGLADTCGKYEAASAALDESLAICAMCQARDHQRCRAYLLQTMGRVAHHRGDRQQAAVLFCESLALYQALGAKKGVEECLEGLAAVAEGEQQPVRAARLFGAAAALRDQMHCPVPPVHRAEHERHLAAVRVALGENRFAAAWAEGQAMPLEDAIAEALNG